MGIGLLTPGDEVVNARLQSFRVVHYSLPGIAPGAGPASKFSGLVIVVQMEIGRRLMTAFAKAVRREWWASTFGRRRQVSSLGRVTPTRIVPSAYPSRRYISSGLPGVTPATVCTFMLLDHRPS